MLQVFFFVLIATGTAIGQSPVDDIQCYGWLNWTIIEPKAHLGSPPFDPQTVARNAVDGVVPNTAQGPGNGELYKCAMTQGWSVKKSLTIDLHRTHLISSVKTYLRENMRAVWQNGLKVYVGPNNNTHEGNSQCGLAYIHQRDNYEPVFNCSPSVEGRFVFLLKSDDNEPDYIRRQGLQVCEVAVNGDKCYCPPYQVRKRIDNKAKCVCLRRDMCSSDYNPVCGDDGKNYINECLMKVAGCLAENPGISVAKQGNCQYGGLCLTERPSSPEENPRCGFFTRYYYDYTRGECKSFQFGGCFVGRNSFFSRKECEDTCKPIPCGLEKDCGLCAGREERWYYNSVTKRCERFEYTGCFGNENNFVSEAKCYERCEDYSKPTTPPPSIEECCNHILKGNQNICEKSKYVVAAKIVKVKEVKKGFAKYEIKVTDVMKGKRKGELWNMTSLEISRDGKCSTILCPQFDVGDKFLVGGKKQRNTVVHLDREDNYLKPFTKDKRDQLQRVCN